MGARLKVDGAELEKFVARLNTSNDSLRGLRKALSEATVSGLGSDELDGACEDFQNDWKYGTEQIGEQTENLAKVIDKNKESYFEVDKALEEAMRKSREKAARGVGGGGK